MPEGHVLHRAARCRDGASAASRSGRRHRRDASPTGCDPQRPDHHRHRRARKASLLPVRRGRHPARASRIVRQIRVRSLPARSRRPTLGSSWRPRPIICTSPARRRASSSPRRTRTISALDSVRIRSSIPLMEPTNSGAGSAAGPSRSGRPARPEGGRRDRQRVPVRAVVPCRNPSVDRRQVPRAWAIDDIWRRSVVASRTARRWARS